MAASQFFHQLDHPFAAVADSKGEFRIADVPAGTHELWVWSAGEARLWKRVEVGASGVTEVEAP